MEDTKSLFRPTPDQMDQMYREMGTTEDQIVADVKAIAEWMRMQPHLRNIKVDECLIRTFLILRKNRMERTKEALDQYYAVKFMAPEFFDGMDPTLPELKESMNLEFFVPFPKLTEEGYRVSMSLMRDPKIDNYVFSDHIKVCFMSIDIRMSKLDMFKKEIFIFDLAKYTVAHLAQTLPELKKMIYCVTTAYPLRIHQIHVVNMPSFAQVALNLAIGVLKKKISNRILVHNSIDDLKKYIDPKILPSDYGGQFPKTSEEICEIWKEELTRHKDWFLSRKSDVYDESKRMKKHNVKLGTIAGLEGSFRRLEVD